MKRIYIVLITCLMTVTAFAQTEVFMGPSFGLGLNRIREAGNGEGGESSDLLIHTYSGVPLEIRFNDYIAIQSGFLYAGRGGADSDFNDKIIIHSLEFPILAKAGYGKNNTWQVYAITGFKIGTAVKATYVDTEFDYKEDLEFGGNGELKRGYFGLQLGAGFSYKAGPGKIVFDITNDIAFTRMVKGSFLIEGDRVQRQRNANFSIGYLFSLNGKSNN